MLLFSFYSFFLPLCCFLFNSVYWEVNYWEYKRDILREIGVRDSLELENIRGLVFGERTKSLKKEDEMEAKLANKMIVWL